MVTAASDVGCKTSLVTKQTQATVDDVRAVAAGLPRSYEVVVYGRLKFRVGQIVWLSFSHDQTVMGFSFPKELRDALVESDPGKFSFRTRRTCASTGSRSTGSINLEEMQELVVDAWSSVVPKFVIAEYAAAHPV